MPADLDLKGRLVINNSKDADLEMIEHALNELSLKPVLGAQSARGCGEKPPMKWVVTETTAWCGGMQTVVKPPMKWVVTET